MANHATPSFPRMITQQLIFKLQYQHTAKQISKENLEKYNFSIVLFTTK